MTKFEVSKWDLVLQNKLRFDAHICIESKEITITLVDSETAKSVNIYSLIFDGCEEECVLETFGAVFRDLLVTLY